MNPCEGCENTDYCDGYCPALEEWIEQGRTEYRYPEEDPAAWMSEVI